MTTEIKMTCRMEENSAFRFMVTEHHIDESIAIHGRGLDANIYCSTTQAKDLVEKLQVAIAELEGKEE